ncbi:MAG: 30S ribosomal protein S4 [Candidatus Omnitrophica bacterium]|nr:30S ribosomal protein S4 [Candidatus Omnitrophota bacterium]MDD5310658.1 30S ribosomal protein S4 [Candidatus Omnitrophota bacterium]MDD5545662.1 30S ribosomal protein S4 [Candidatus Omnitrophota bacterium]
MAKYKDAVCRLCRREGSKLFLKGTRCYTPKCGISRREYAPGQHGQGRIKLSDYGLQLREKQKLKRIYGVLEKQFRNYFKTANKSKGVTGEILLQLLERRFDNALFRSGLANSTADARQVIAHGHVKINGRRTDIPSYSVKVGDTVKIESKEGIVKHIKSNIELTKDRGIPKWMTVDANGLEVKIVKLPSREDIGFPIQEQLIVELYSK